MKLNPHVREFVTHPLILFVGALGAAGLAVSAFLWKGVTSLMLMLAGAAVYAVAEYISHRFILHRYPKLLPALHAGHMAHHKDPNDAKYLFSPVHYDMIIYIAYLAFLWLLFRDPSTIAPMVTGTLLFQLYYQWMHFAAHRPIVPRTAFGRWMKKKHLLHHFQDESTWFGVSHPVLDLIFRTHRSKNPEQKQIPWLG